MGMKEFRVLGIVLLGIKFFIGFLFSFCRAARFSPVAEGCPAFSASCICQGFIFQLTYSFQKFFRLLRLFRSWALTSRFRYHLCIRAVPQSFLASHLSQKLFVWGQDATYFSWPALCSCRRFPTSVRITRYSTSTSSRADSGQAGYSTDFTTLSCPHE